MTKLQTTFSLRQGHQHLLPGTDTELFDHQELQGRRMRVDQEHVIYKKAVGAKPHEDELALSCFVGLLSSRCSQLERSVVSHHERVTLVESTFLKGIMKDMTLANPEDWIFLKFLMECYVIESVQALYIKQRWKKDS